MFFNAFLPPQKPIYTLSHINFNQSELINIIEVLHIEHDNKKRFMLKDESEEILD